LKPAYTVREVAEPTGFSRETVTKLFENERRVIVLALPRNCTSAVIEAPSVTGLDRFTIPLGKAKISLI
jgi:hypothetical protein